MPFYEHVFLARQDVSPSQAEQMAKDFQTVLEGLGAKVTKSEYWGLKSLAFKVKKSRKAHYMMYNIDGPHAAVAEMQRADWFFLGTPWERAWHVGGPILIAVALILTLYSGLGYLWKHRALIATE